MGILAEEVNLLFCTLKQQGSTLTGKNLLFLEGQILSFKRRPHFKELLPPERQTEIHANFEKKNHYFREKSQGAFIGAGTFVGIKTVLLFLQRRLSQSCNYPR